MFEMIFELSKGVPISLLITFLALFFAFTWAVSFSYILFKKTFIANQMIKMFLSIFTGTPLLIQIFLIYHGAGQFPELSKNHPLMGSILSNPLYCAILALALNSAAYTTLLFFGTLKTIPTEQWNVCAALGMTKSQQFKTLFPLALRRSISAYSNEIILIFKATALTSTITIMDIMGYSKQLFGLTYDFSVYLAAGIIYLIINGILTIILRAFESKALAFEK